MKFPSNNNIICFGEALWDIFNDKAMPGGAPLNVAIHLINLGLETELISRVGNDKLGNELRQFLSSCGLSEKYIQISPKLPTGTVEIKLDKENNATYHIQQPSAWDEIAFTNDIESLLNISGIVIYGTLASRDLSSRNTLNQILESNLLKIIDINLRSPFNLRSVVEPLIQKSDIIKLNEEEIQKIASWHKVTFDNHNMIKYLSDIYECNTIILTLGNKGALVYDEGKLYSHKGYSIRAADTVGAGDAFLAAMVFSICNKQDIEEGLDLACLLGAYVASKRGATPSINLNEINRIKNIRC